ncbi:hypothetical protein OVA14_10540 [Agrococcus sp. SL85]|uniref:hypothetical protein n=1 Tax=Agrococcus sp. SL85 TaxID=2995141 RepID=UPI00226C9F8F|nr:hypothetical protein [Agrococcus sp. SL85]WAC65755.1 hypothetical protein OVA14_10540 [Agrococcus sp. SL85]
MIEALTEKAPAEVKVGEGQENAPAEATNLAEIVPACESRWHSEDHEGHGPGNATHAVLVECPWRCSEPRWVLLCAGKVSATLVRAALGRSVRCARCDRSAGVWSFWARLVSLASLEVVAARPDGRTR